MHRLFCLFLLCLAPSTLHAGQLSLQECLQAADAANPLLMTSRHAPLITSQDKAIASGAQLPHIDLQAGAVFQAAPQAVRFGGMTQETQQANYTVLSLSATQVLYDFGKTSSRIGQADRFNRASEARVETVRQDVFLQVVHAYYGTLREQILLKTAEEEVLQRERHQKNVSELYSAGVVTRNDLLLADVKLAGSRQQRLATANRLSNAWLRLNYLTGNPSEFRGDLQPEEQFHNGIDESDLSERPELHVQEQLVAAAEESTREADAADYPELFARLSVDYVQNDKVREQSIYAATVGLKVNLFDGSASAARKRRAAEQLSEERDRLRNLLAASALEYQTALNDLNVAREKISVAEKAISQSEENLRITTDRYLAQVGTSTDVIDAQTLLTQTKTDYQTARYDFQIARARLKRAAGTL